MYSNNFRINLFIYLIKRCEFDLLTLCLVFNLLLVFFINVVLEDNDNIVIQNVFNVVSLLYCLFIAMFTYLENKIYPILFNILIILNISLILFIGIINS